MLNEQAIETLNHLAGTRIQELEEELETAHALLHMRHRHHPSGDNAFGIGAKLPLPRIQMSRVGNDRYCTWYTGIVYPTFWDLTDDDKQSDMELQWIPVEHTEHSGERWSAMGTTPDEPHRGSFHLRADAEVLGLPAYVVDHVNGTWGQVGNRLAGGAAPEFLRTGRIEELKPVRATTTQLRSPGPARAMVAAERIRQVQELGLSSTHDHEGGAGPLAEGAIGYISSSLSLDVQRAGCDSDDGGVWPDDWLPQWDKRPGPDAGRAERIRGLVKGVALGLAALDVLCAEDPKAAGEAMKRG